MNDYEHGYTNCREIAINWLSLRLDSLMGGKGNDLEPHIAELKMAIEIVRSLKLNAAGTADGQASDVEVSKRNTIGHTGEAARASTSLIDNALASGETGSSPAAPNADHWPCTCHQDDNPPVPCPQKFALAEGVCALCERDQLKRELAEAKELAKRHYAGMVAEMDGRLAALRELEAARPSLAARPSEEAVRLAREFVADPGKRAQVKVQLSAHGWQQLADLIDEAVVVSQELQRLAALTKGEE